jgi:hypothetical protein
LTSKVTDLMPASSPGLSREDFGGEALALGPAQVHALEHFGPILGVGAAGAGVDFDDGGGAVVGTGELELKFAAGELLGELSEGALGGFEVAGIGAKLAQRFDLVADAVLEVAPAVDMLG